MLVGDVRCATTGAGSSWKLSGGRDGRPTPTKVSKKCHVRRAVSAQDVVVSSSVSGSTSSTCIGGADRPRDDGRQQPERDERRGPRPGAGAPEADQRRRRRRPARRHRPCAATNVASVASCRAFACAAVTHSSRWRRVTRRTTVRTIASVMSQAWCASSVRLSATCVMAIAASVRTPRTWLRFEIPRRRGTTSWIAGHERRQQQRGDDERRPQTGRSRRDAASSRRAAGRSAGASSVRRRLSSIFQRPISGRLRGRLDRRSRAAAASRHGPSDAGERRRPGSSTGTPRTARRR